MSFGRSSGGFWRSPSIVTTISPRARDEPRVHRRVLAEVALQPDAAHARVGRVQALDRCSNEPSVEPSSTKISSKSRPSSAATRAAVELLERARLVEDGDDDRQLGHRASRVHRDELAPSRPDPIARDGRDRLRRCLSLLLDGYASLRQRLVERGPVAATSRRPPAPRDRERRDRAERRRRPRRPRSPGSSPSTNVWPEP